MLQVPLATSSTQYSTDAFWEAVTVYHDRPHLVNRRLLAASQALFYKVIFSCKDVKHISELFTKPAILYEMRKLESISKEAMTVEFLKNMIDCFDKNVELIPVDEKAFQEERHGIFVSARVLLPRKNVSGRCVEVAVLDKDKNIATFMAVAEQERLAVPLTPPFQYEIELSSNYNLRVNIQNFEDADSPHSEWLVDKLFKKLISWADNYRSDRAAEPSLHLIPIFDYSLLYNQLKEKYVPYLIQEWSNKTTTDPQKFIHEDISIATYLICLWKTFEKMEINFVDCGCGNGLLVYLLHQEGYAGYGIDIRRRPVWDIYPPDVRLEVGTVGPDSRFPDSTWLIGNHSDELTPWLPVIALKSSLVTNFFVLPCCPYDFSGQKYVRMNSGISVYQDYFTYIRDISSRCGFETSCDRLRMPSTKRNCLIGIRSLTDGDRQIETIRDVNEYINSRMKRKFEARNNVEPVRNCTQLQTDLIKRILSFCVDYLLQEKNLIVKDNKSWNKGRTVSLSEISELVDRADRQKMKKECGGIQTLLRNHRYIFEVANGCVSLREPLKYSEVTKYKSKPCWNFKYHPDHCLYDADECAYSHNVDE